MDRGILLEDRNERMIRLPVNRNYCFPGGVGDPSAVASGDHLYVFFGEYAYPTAWTARRVGSRRRGARRSASASRASRSTRSTLRLAAARGGTATASRRRGTAPVSRSRVCGSRRDAGGGAVSQGDELYYWGPSVSWNEELEVWVMLMGRVDGSFWVGDSLFLSINPHRDLGEGDNAQQWSTPVRIIHRPGHTLWYPALQPTDSPEDLAARRTCLRLGREARLFFKDMTDDEQVYISDHRVEFFRRGT